MSYKKFSRNHGNTSRIRKYKWSNPDHNFRGEVGWKSHNSMVHGMEITLFREGFSGCRHSNPNKRQLRKVRRILNLEVRVFFR